MTSPRTRRLASIVLFAVSSLCLAGCPEEKAKPVERTAPVRQPAVERAAPVVERAAPEIAYEAPRAPQLSGAELFVRNGCSACHGADALGTAAAPAVAGTDPAAVATQVRTPRDRMPPFAASVITDAQLERIAEYVARLAPAPGPPPAVTRTGGAAGALDLP